MTTVSRIRICLTALMIALTTATACASPGPHRHRHHQRRVVTVVHRPAATLHVVNRMTRHDRLALALGWLETHDCITARRYAKLTGLSQAAARAELDSLASGESAPLKVVASGRKRVYARN